MMHPDSFEEGYLQSAQDEQAVAQAAQASPAEQAAAAATERRPAANIDYLGIQLMSEFGDAERARAMAEQRWLGDLAQYRGIYDEQTWCCLKAHKRSRAYYRLTTAKVDTVTARLMDLLFPQKSTNWDISPTPDPMIPDDVLAQELAPEIAALTEQLFTAKSQEAAMQMQVQGMPPDPLAMQALQQQLMAQCQQEALQATMTPEAVKRVAKERAKRMQDVIEDQLRECSANGMTRPSWRQNCRRVVKSCCLYGMGVLKGPLIERVETKRFTPQQGQDGSMSWQEEVYAEELRPYHEAVSIWEVYPDPGARIPSELRYVWQRHTKTDKELRELLQVPGFNASVITQYMLEHDEGDAEYATWETQVRSLNSDNVTNGGLGLSKRYLLYERWGYLSGKELAEAGVEIAEDQYAEIFPSCVWILGDKIIKAAVNPLEGVDIPFHFYPFQEDESSFWPEGIAYRLRDIQDCINSVVRAMQDNVALTCGPILGINVAGLSSEETLDDMRAGKCFLFDQQGVNLNEVFQAVTVPSALANNLQLFTFYMESADEITSPRFNQGNGAISGAGNTASGLSMLMGNANILLKDHIKDFDDHIVTPFIRAMFRWNMKWNPREDIKGDFEVVANGSESMIAKEVRAQQIPAFLSLLQNPSLAIHINERKLLEVMVEQTDLPAERILRTEEEAQQRQQELMLMQAQAQMQAMMQAQGQSKAQGQGQEKPSSAEETQAEMRSIPTLLPKNEGPTLRQLPVQGPGNVL